MSLSKNMVYLKMANSILNNQGKSQTAIGGMPAEVCWRAFKRTSLNSPGFVKKYQYNSYQQPLSITFKWISFKQGVFITITHHLYLLGVSKPAQKIISSEALRGTSPAGHLPFAKGCQIGTEAVFGSAMAPFAWTKSWEKILRCNCGNSVEHSWTISMCEKPTI